MRHRPVDRLQRIQECKTVAASRGGVCLSGSYIDTKTKLKWQCAKGHKWEALPWNVLKGHWCLICGNEQQGRAKAHSIEVAQKAAERKGGLCLSTEYKNNNTKLRWRCAKGHEWEAVPTSITSGSWCPMCAGKLPTEQALLGLQQIALGKGGLLLSKNYRGAFAKLWWRCEYGHEWQAAPNNVKQGSWCLICGGSHPLTLTDMQAAAKSLGGECLSTEYINSHTPLLWRCAEGHEWKANPTHVRDGHWCPICSVGISERICRALLEHITRVPFPKRHPAWLKNEDGNGMELDGYAESLAVAFEYHGRQHFQEVPFFHRDEYTLMQRMRDDATKRLICQQNGVSLIEVPHDIPHNGMQDFLIRKLKELLPNKQVIQNEEKIDLQNLGVRNIRRLDAMRAIAVARGGECLSDFYINNNTRLRWRCSKGHEWEAVPSSIKSGSWCSLCGDVVAARKRAYTIEEMHAFAAKKGGECLCTNYQNSKSRLRWRWL
jgi:hypothetical protein